MKNKTLGLIGMICSPFLAIDFLLSGMYQSYQSSTLSGVCNLVYMTGWFCSIAGFYGLKAAGIYKIGRSILIIQLVFLGLGEFSNIYRIVQPSAETTLFKILDLFWPISNGFMIVTGLFILFEHRLKSWRKWTVFISGMWLPVTIICSNINGLNKASLIISGIYCFLAWLFLGLSVFLTPVIKQDQFQIKNKLVHANEE